MFIHRNRKGLMLWCDGCELQGTLAGHANHQLEIIPLLDRPVTSQNQGPELCLRGCTLHFDAGANHVVW